MYKLIARTCDRLIEWADYVPDARWERIGRFVPNHTAERINAFIDRRTNNRQSWR